MTDRVIPGSNSPWIRGAGGALIVVFAYAILKIIFFPFTGPLDINDSPILVRAGSLELHSNQDWNPQAQSQSQVTSLTSPLHIYVQDKQGKVTPLSIKNEDWKVAIAYPGGEELDLCDTLQCTFTGAGSSSVFVSHNNLGTLTVEPPLNNRKLAMHYHVDKCDGSTGADTHCDHASSITVTIGKAPPKQYSCVSGSVYGICAAAISDK